MSGRAAGLLGAGIGLIAEAVAHRNEQRSSSQAQVQLRAPQAPQAAQQSPYQDEPPSYEQANESRPSASRSYQDLHSPEEKPWISEKRSFDAALDDDRRAFGESSSASTPLNPPRAPLTNNPVPLPLPVIIPQRRPENKARGWAICYAPMLEQSGIDQATFLDFILKFNKACQASPYLNVINLAAVGAGFAPSAIAQVVSFAIPVAVEAAKKAQIKVQSSNYINKANAELFEPLGLFAMMVTYKPGQQSKILSMDIQGPPADNSSGQQWQLPPSAPLVFIDERELDSGKPLNQWQRTGRFVADYMDRRAQARVANQNPGADNLQPAPQFSSVWSDPNSAAHGGSLIQFVSGGLIQKPTREDKKAQRRGRDTSSRGSQGLIAGVKSMALGEKNQDKGWIRGLQSRVMQENQVYLVIANKPSNAPVAPAMANPAAVPASGLSSNNQFYSSPMPPRDPATYNPFYSNRAPTAANEAVRDPREAEWEAEYYDNEGAYYEEDQKRKE